MEGLKYYDVVDGRTKDIVKVLEAADIRAAASIIDKDDSFDGKWRRQFIIRPSPPNCFVIGEKRTGLEFIDPKSIPENAQRRRFEGGPTDGKTYYYVVRSSDRDTEGRIEAFLRPDTIDVTPQKVFRATKIKEIIVLWAVLNAQKTAKLVVGLLVALIIGMLLIFYLLVKGN